MSNLTGAPTFDNVYQIEQTDVARGGAGNLANAQAQALLNRTEWLKNAIRGYNDINLLNAAVTLTIPDVLQKLVVIYANTAYSAYILPTVASGDFGLRVSIAAHNIAKQVTITSAGNDIIVGSTTRQSLFLGDGDSIELIWTGTNWVLLNFSGNFNEVSNPLYGYYQLPNTIVAGGQLINRADYPRLWECVNTNLSGSIVSESTWNTIAGNKGFYTAGNGSTTFRVPDLRAMFIRGLDLGAGIDLGRPTNNPGDYEADAFKSHHHNYSGTTTDGQSRKTQTEVVRTGYGDRGIYLLDANDYQTTDVGGTETRPKNIGLLPLIKI